MAQNWDYAELSKAAKAAGGPEKYVDMLKQASRNAGKMEMLPWVGVAAVGASLLTVEAIKIVDHFKFKKRQNQEEIEKAKQEIIEGIKAYDAEHDTSENDVTVKWSETVGGVWVLVSIGSPFVLSIVKNPAEFIL